MSTLNSTKMPWTAKEIAFIIGYADYCIHHGADFSATVAGELSMLSSRTITWNTIRGKLEKVFKGYGFSNPSIQELRSQGITSLDMGAVPSDVLTELNVLRDEWGFAPLRTRTTASGPYTAVIDETGPCANDETGSSATNQLGLQMDINRQSKTLQVEEKPELRHSGISAIDGAVDRPSMSPISTPSPFAPTKPAVEKKRAVSPEDSKDSEYQPSPKRNRSAATSSGRAPTNAFRDLRGAAEPRKKAPTKQNTAVRQNGTSVVIIDEPSESLQAVASPSQVAKQIAEPLNRDAGKRNADLVSEVENTTIKALSKRKKTEEMTLENANTKIDACLAILSGLITHQSSSSEETSDHYRQIIRTLEDPNGSIVKNLIEDLDSQRALKAKHRDLVQKLVEFVNLNTCTVFPKEPPQQEVNQSWTAFYEHIVSTVGPNNTTPKITAARAGYLTGSVENIAYGRISGDQLNSYIESLSTLFKSPQAQQALLSALFCLWIFASPEPMLHSMHSDGMMHLYNGVLSSASTTASGLARVQQYDKAAAKLMFEDPNFQRMESARRSTEFKSRLQTVKDKLCQKSDIPSSKSPSKFAREVIEFKQRLLLSPKHYRIHYVRPETLFDPSWMQAYSASNDLVSDARAAGKKIMLCMFPALTCEKGKIVGNEAKIEDVLVKNKRFFPTFKESIDFDPNMQLSKAVVLLSVDEEKKR